MKFRRMFLELIIYRQLTRQFAGGPVGSWGARLKPT